MGRSRSRSPPRRRRSRSYDRRDRRRDRSLSPPPVEHAPIELTAEEKAQKELEQKYLDSLVSAHAEQRRAEAEARLATLEAQRRRELTAVQKAAMEAAAKQRAREAEDALALSSFVESMSEPADRRHMNFVRGGTLGTSVLPTVNEPISVKSESKNVTAAKVALSLFFQPKSAAGEEPAVTKSSIPPAGDSSSSSSKSVSSFFSSTRSRSGAEPSLPTEPITMQPSKKLKMDSLFAELCESSSNCSLSSLLLCRLRCQYLISCILQLLHHLHPQPQPRRYPIIFMLHTFLYTLTVRLPNLDLNSAQSSSCLQTSFSPTVISHRSK